MWETQKNTFFHVFGRHDDEKKLEAGDRTILMLPHQPMAHFDRYYPHFWWVLTEMTTLQNFGVPDPPKVGRTRFVSRKKHDLGPIFGTKSPICPISNIFTPPMIYIVGKLWISGSIWQRAIEILSIPQAVRILMTPWNRNEWLISDPVICTFAPFHL